MTSEAEAAVGAGTGGIAVCHLGTDRFAAHPSGHTGRILMLGFMSDEDRLVPAAAEDPHHTGRRLGGAGMWQRGENWIAARDADWLHLGDHRSPNGGWEGMFVPNGQGTLEWRLGWAATIPTGTFLMVMPPPDHAPDGLQVPIGVIPAKAVNAMTDRGGMSIAVRPEHPVTVHRGQGIARIMLLHPRLPARHDPHRNQPAGHGPGSGQRRGTPAPASSRESRPRGQAGGRKMTVPATHGRPEKPASALRQLVRPPVRGLLTLALLARTTAAVLPITLLLALAQSHGYAHAALVSGGYTLVLAFCAPLRGPLLDRYGAHRMLTLMGAATALLLGLVACSVEFRWPWWTTLPLVITALADRSAHRRPAHYKSSTGELRDPQYSPVTPSPTETTDGPPSVRPYLRVVRASRSFW
ncbi:hypothetical protein GCM10009647_025000 [Streptomyces sanglieri]|uniref:MFS transporter n=1 Tax=Streptomyces sanglieri TaxID=193460 RepID=A0ABW2XCV4_9ACTN|nr:MFS transporter [Streptomyces sp. Wh19]MDV9197224.1 hypothetical protein [Streptomyces sp. Wh19]